MRSIAPCQLDSKKSARSGGANVFANSQEGLSLGDAIGKGNGPHSPKISMNAIF
jgi:hypothetical protein